jgi:hypothetical protein
VANGNGNGKVNNNQDGNGNCNGNRDSNGNDDVTVTTTDTRECCLFMCRQCAALWQRQCLASPPWTQRSVHCPVLHHGGAVAKSACFISRGRDSESSPWIDFFYFFSITCSNYLITLCFLTQIQFPKNPVSLLTIYSSSYCTFSQGIGWG